MLSVGFYTLLERKILALRQTRLGPNKNWYYGIIQPLLDALKLIKKTLRLNIKLSLRLTYVFCFLMLILSLFIWLSIPFKRWSNRKSLIVFWLLSLVRFRSFIVLILGWRSIRKYSYIGRIRSVCQTISLEIILTSILLRWFLLLRSLNLNSIKYSTAYLNLRVYLGIMFIVALIETHRAPFDLAEGEREIVRGYNTEFRRIMFVTIFLSEYSNLLFIRVFLVFLGFGRCSIFLFVLVSFTLLVRRCFPRLRYDILIKYTWIHMLPSIIFISLYLLSHKVFI